MYALIEAYCVQTDRLWAYPCLSLEEYENTISAVSSDPDFGLVVTTFPGGLPAELAPEPIERRRLTPIGRLRPLGLVLVATVLVVATVWCSVHLG